MHALTIATSSSRGSSLALSTSKMQALSEKKETLIQRVDALRVELEALETAHKAKTASLQPEQKKWDLAIEHQQTQNVALQTKNNELRRKIALYQETYAAHRCPNGLVLAFCWPNVNFQRAMYRQGGSSIEVFLHLLRNPNPPYG